MESMTSSFPSHRVIIMNYISVLLVANLRTGYYKHTVSAYICIKYISKMQDKDKLEIIDDGRLEIVQTSSQQQSDNSMQKFLSLSAPKAS